MIEQCCCVLSKAQLTVDDDTQIIHSDPNMWGDQALFFPIRVKIHKVFVQIFPAVSLLSFAFLLAYWKLWKITLVDEDRDLKVDRTTKMANTTRDAVRYSRAKRLFSNQKSWQGYFELKWQRAATYWIERTLETRNPKKDTTEWKIHPTTDKTQRWWEDKQKNNSERAGDINSRADNYENDTHIHTNTHTFSLFLTIGLRCQGQVGSTRLQSAHRQVSLRPSSLIQHAGVHSGAWNAHKHQH